MVMDSLDRLITAWETKKQSGLSSSGGRPSEFGFLVIEEAEVQGSDEEMEEEKERPADLELESVQEDEIEGSVDDESGHSKGEEEFVEGEEDDAYWEYDECIYSHTKATNSCKGRTRRPNMQGLRSFDNQERA